MKLTRFIFTGLIILLSLQTAVAQTITDSQIIEYATQRNAAGANRKTIANELLGKGATVDQLKRLLSNKGTSSLSTSGTTNLQDVSRSRENNEEVIDLPFENKVDSADLIFGHDIFRSRLLSFEPNMSIAISPNYVLGPGDEMIIDVYGASQNTQKIKIAPDGSVTIPRIGPVNVSGLTVEAAQARIRKVMGKHYQSSTIKVSVGQTRTISINVMGDVRTPGTYTLSAFATVFHALYMAGGIDEKGTLRDIRVVRNGRVISTIDVYEYIMSGRLAGDVRLKDQDVILVGAYKNLVKIVGKVKRPMIYEMKDGESLKSLLRFCDGFTGDAYTKNVKVDRRSGMRLEIYTVDEFDFSSFDLHDEDSVSVQGNEQRYGNMVAVLGAVKRPGEYSLSSTKTVHELIDIAGGLEEYALKTRAVLTRLNEDRTHRTISIDLKGILNGTAPDVALENEDRLTISSIPLIKDDRKMTILGEVHKPGTFDFADNTTIEDLIIMAGGLNVAASLLNVEVSRRIIDPKAPSDSIVRSEVFKFTLNPDMTVAEDNDFILQPFDRVHVRRSPVFVDQHSVNISGEVVFAGNYTLKNDNIRLSDIIREAGGLKKGASAKNARLLRYVNQAERTRNKILENLSKDANDSIDIEIEKTEYYVGIDLEKALEFPGSDYDPILRDSDQIIIPAMLNTVSIDGEVLYPNNVTYLKGKSYKYYINQAGGYTKNSLKRHAYIVYANGNVDKKKKKIEPGCQIIIPSKPGKKDNSAETMKWVSIMTSVTTVVALLINSLK